MPTSEKITERAPEKKRERGVKLFGSEEILLLKVKHMVEGKGR